MEKQGTCGSAVLAGSSTSGKVSGTAETQSKHAFEVRPCVCVLLLRSRHDHRDRDRFVRCIGPLDAWMEFMRPLLSVFPYIHTSARSSQTPGT